VGDDVTTAGLSALAAMVTGCAAGVIHQTSKQDGTPRAGSPVKLFGLQAESDGDLFKR